MVFSLEMGGTARNGKVDESVGGRGRSVGKEKGVIWGGRNGKGDELPCSSQVKGTMERATGQSPPR